jgi:hypothetical protein
MNWSWWPFAAAEERGRFSLIRHGRDDADQKLWLRRYHQAEFMRIGLRIF